MQLLYIYDLISVIFQFFPYFWSKNLLSVDYMCIVTQSFPASKGDWWPCMHDEHFFTQFLLFRCSVEVVALMCPLIRLPSLILQQEETTITRANHWNGQKVIQCHSHQVRTNLTQNWEWYSSKVLFYNFINVMYHFCLLVVCINTVSWLMVVFVRFVYHNCSNLYLLHRLYISAK